MYQQLLLKEIGKANKIMDSKNSLSSRYSKAYRPEFGRPGRSQRSSSDLKSFHNEVFSMLRSMDKKKPKKKVKMFPNIKTQSSQEVQQLKKDLTDLKQLISNRFRVDKVREENAIQTKLQRVLAQLQAEKNKRELLQERLKSNSHMNQPSTQTTHMYIPPSPYIFPQSQPLYPLYYNNPQYEEMHFKKRRPRLYTKPIESEQQDQQIDRKKSVRNTKNKNVEKKSNKFFQKKKTRLRIYILAVCYFIFLRSEAKKSAMARRKHLQTECKQNFYSQIQNIKNWVLECQKNSLSIILEKKHLNFNYFNQKSLKIRTQKMNLIMRIVKMGIQSMLQQSKPQKIKLFYNCISNLCLFRSFPIHNFWTKLEMEQVCVSEFYGFFKIDKSLEKFLMAVLIFIKVFIFNIMLQPYKFDQQNFPKGAEPLLSNMMLISSVYYDMIKEILQEYKDQARDEKYYKIGNYLEAKHAKVKCSQSMVYGKRKIDQKQYISGLYRAEQFEELKDHKDSKQCYKNLKKVIENIYEFVNQQRTRLKKRNKSRIQ